MAGKRLHSYLAARTLLAYSLLYVLVTLTFATAYWMLPGQFYHSTAMHEPMLKTDEQLIRSGLHRILLEHWRKNHGAEVLTLDGRDFPVDGLSVYNFEYERGQFKVSTTILGEQHCAVIPHIIIPARTEEYWFEEEMSDEHVMISAKFGELGIDEYGSPMPQQESAFDSFITLPRGENRPIKGMLKIPRSLFDMMSGYADAKEGFAGRTKGSFWRMLYLSTVTITTVGYGDIVPITPLARTLIAAEAVLGMLVIGLYLNALSQRLGPGTPS